MKANSQAKLMQIAGTKNIIRST